MKVTKHIKDEQTHYGENGEEWQSKCIHAVED